MNTVDHSNKFRILYYCSGWPINIGNAFIDLGATAILRAALPQAQIYFASEMPRWIFDFAEKGQREQSRRFRFRRATRQSFRDNALDIAAVTDCDLLVFSGMAMCEEFIRVNGPTVLALSSRRVPVLLLGTGAEYYSREEQKLFGEFLSQLRPLGFISRDDRSYEMFGSFVTNAFKGIDCAFFLPEAYKPLPLSLPSYTVVTFDLVPEPPLGLNGRTIIRAHHSCWGPSPENYLTTENTLISDIPHDYLTLYANAEELHSDRVHACAATLAYGRRARLYSSTPRASMFDAVGASKVRESLVQLDTQMLAEMKNGLVETVRNLVKGAL